MSDLEAVVHTGGVPDGILEELPGLYGSVFSTEPWFRIFDEQEPTGVCILSHPRNILAFAVRGDTVEILNKACPIGPDVARRGCTAIFRALPGARRIHLEVLFPPRELGLPRRELYAASDLVIELPTSVEAYGASLGKRTRKNLRNYENRLRREFPDVTVEVAAVGDRSPALVSAFLAWHLSRCQRRGISSGYEKKPKQPGQVTQLLRESGIAQTISIGGRLAAVEFIIYVGDEATLYAGSFDERHEDIHLGFLSSYWAVCETIRHGARRCHLLWDTDYYKQRLGACPVPATRLSVFRSHPARLWSPQEALWVLLQRMKRLRVVYWRARHAAGRLVRALGKRSESG